MAPKVTVLKVCISCDKCKTKLLKAVAGLEGVNKIEADEEKGTLTVAGPVDPHAVIVRAKKAGKCVEIVSIGDPKKPDPPKDGDKDKCKHGKGCTKPTCLKPECPKPICCKLECCEKPSPCQKPPCHKSCGCKACQLSHVVIPFEIPVAPNYPGSSCAYL